MMSVIDYDAQPDIAQIPHLEDCMWRAETRFNINWIERFFHSEFLEFGCSGRTYRFSDLIADRSISESALISELNKSLRKNHKQQYKGSSRRNEDFIEAPVIKTDFNEEKKFADDTIEHQERDILRIMINYHDQKFRMSQPLDEVQTEELNVLDFLLDEIEGDDLIFETPSYRELFSEVSKEYDEKLKFDQNFFIHHEKETIRSLFVDLMTFPYNLDNWARMEIFVTSEDQKLRRAVIESLFAYKSKRVERMIRDNQAAMKDSTTLGSDPTPFLEKQMKLESIKREINKTLGRTVLH